MKQKGQTLVEVLIALTAAIIVISAIVVVVISSLSSVSFSTSQTVASQLVDQGVQLVRHMKDEDWATVSAYAVGGETYCLDDTCTQLDGEQDECWISSSSNENCVNNIATAGALFTRKVTLEDNILSCNPPTPPGGTLEPLNGIKATVEVRWADARCENATDLCHVVEYSSCMANLDSIAAP